MAAELTAELELWCRQTITTKAAGADGVNFAITEPSFFTGKEDFAAQLGLTNEANTDAVNAALIDNLLCDFVMTSYETFEDKKFGPADCPMAWIFYEMLVFQEFRKGLENETNAHNRHVGTVLAIRNKFLRGQRIRTEPTQIRHFSVKQSGKTAKNQETIYLPGVKGFFTILQTIVEVS